MARGETNFEIFCFLSFLLFGQSLSAPRVFDEILDSLKNIEDLIRESSQPSIYITSPVGRNGVVNSAQLLRSRDLVVNIESLDNDEAREYLKRHPQQARSPSGVSPQSSNEANANSNADINQLQSGNEDDFESGKPVPLRSLILKKKPRILAKPQSDNSNSNVNSNLNSNVNSVRKNSVDADSRLKSSGSNSGIGYAIGDRSLSNRLRDANRNANLNTNTNINANNMFSMDDDEEDEER